MSLVNMCIGASIDSEYGQRNGIRRASSYKVEEVRYTLTSQMGKPSNHPVPSRLTLSSIS